ncbi:L,D-transpeptidase [Lyngbya sp. CCY1209]|uniref:L,D-transpeptidase n=1 Tax=Lyngbya sp. CCY1209 TaxID=2886103 RepID=UPI0035C88FFE
MVNCQLLLKSLLSVALSPAILLPSFAGDLTSAAFADTISGKTGLPAKFAASGVDATQLQPLSATVELVIRLGERRVYVYQSDRLLASYPIAIGRSGWETPVGRHKVIQLVRNPTWQHPFTGDLIPPGPDNPLGSRWIGFWTDGTNSIGFHGTPDEDTVGRAASHGCVRMLNRDVLALFEKVAIGTPVTVEP